MQTEIKTMLDLMVERLVVGGVSRQQVCKLLEEALSNAKEKDKTDETKETDTKTFSKVSLKQINVFRETVSRLTKDPTYLHSIGQPRPLTRDELVNLISDIDPHVNTTEIVSELIKLAVLKKLPDDNYTLNPANPYAVHGKTASDRLFLVLMLFKDLLASDLHMAKEPKNFTIGYSVVDDFDTRKVDEFIKVANARVHQSLVGIDEWLEIRRLENKDSQNKGRAFSYTITGMIPTDDDSQE